MSAEWQEVAIGQVCEITSSKRIFAHEYVEKGVPFYGSKEVIDKALGTYSDTTVFISDARFSEIAGKFGYPTAGDLLLSSVGNRAGIPYVIRDEGKFYFKDGNLTWFKEFNGLDSHFLCHWIKSAIGQSSLNSIMIGSAQKALTITGLLKLRISLPSLQEQERIVAVLNALDDRITLLRETNATLEAIAQALFKSWFVDFDPVHAKLEGRAPEGMDEATARLFPDSFEESELGLAPKGWRVGVLTEICKISSGNRPIMRSDAMTDAAPIPLFGGAGIMGFTNESLFQVQKILTGRVGTLGKVHIAYPPFWASDNVLVLSPEESRNFLYCFHWLKSIDVHSLNRGSTQPLLTQKDLGKQQHVIPPEPVLSTFAAIAEVIYEAIRHNAEQAQTLATLRDTLLPRLISGQLRLPEMLEEANA